MKKVNKEPFTNEIGQVLNPGDNVVYVTTGRGHRVSIGTGIFEGTLTSDRYYDRGGKKVRISGIPKRRYVYSNDTGKSGYENYVGTTTLQLNRVFKIDTHLSNISI